MAEKRNGSVEDVAAVMAMTMVTIVVSEVLHDPATGPLAPSGGMTTKQTRDGRKVEVEEQEETENDEEEGGGGGD